MSVGYAKRPRLTAEERRAQDQEALGRIRGNAALSNFGPVMLEFHARGIPLEEISPKENVFTYRAWRALGRQVRKGEKGVKIAVWRPVEGKPTIDQATGEVKPSAYKICAGATVFHVSQTDPIE